MKASRVEHPRQMRSAGKNPTQESAATGDD